MLGVSNLTVQLFEVVLAGSYVPLDDERVRPREIRHSPGVELAT